MPPIIIRIDSAGFDRFVQRLGKIEEQIPRAIAQGLNEGGDKVRTQIIYTLWKQTGVHLKSSITSRIRTSRAFGEGDRMTGATGNMRRASTAAALTYQIIATGKGIPIREFPLTVKLGKGGFVDAKTWGVDHLFQRSFVIKDGGINPYRARLGDARFPIRGLYGPSLPKELVDSARGSAPRVFYTTTEAVLPPILLKKLSRIM